jgi:hypothetical protein
LFSGVVSRRSRVPVVRSLSIATLVIRNITTNGKTPSMITPIRSKSIGSASKTYRMSVSSSDGTTTMRAMVRLS